MARDHPVTDDELEAVREGIFEQREEIRRDLEARGVDVSEWSTLADDVDGDPDAEHDTAGSD